MHPDPGLDLHLEATCQQGHPCPKLAVWDRCSPVSGNPFGFSRPEHRSPAQGKRNCCSRSYPGPGATYRHRSLYLSIIHLLLDTKVPALKPGVLVLSIIQEQLHWLGENCTGFKLCMCLSIWHTSLSVRCSSYSPGLNFNSFHFIVCGLCCKFRESGN